MNQYSAAPPLNPEALIAVLAEVYPKTMSMTTLQAKMRCGKPKIESALMVLVAQGRVKLSTVNTVATVYRLSEDEAEKHGFKRENPVRNSYDLLTARPAYVPKSMAPSRSDANDFLDVYSRRGDRFVPPTTPMGIASSVRGGA